MPTPEKVPDAGMAAATSDRAFRFLAELEAQTLQEDVSLESKALPANEEAQPVHAQDLQEVEQLRELFERPMGLTQRMSATEAPWSPWSKRPPTSYTARAPALPPVSQRWREPVVAWDAPKATLANAFEPVFGDGRPRPQAFLPPTELAPWNRHLPQAERKKLESRKLGSRASPPSSASMDDEPPADFTPLSSVPPAVKPFVQPLCQMSLPSKPWSPPMRQKEMSTIQTFAEQAKRKPIPVKPFVSHQDWTEAEAFVSYASWCQNAPETEEMRGQAMHRSFDAASPPHLPALMELEFKPLPKGLGKAPIPPMPPKESRKVEKQCVGIQSEDVEPQPSQKPKSNEPLGLSSLYQPPGVSAQQSATLLCFPWLSRIWESGHTASTSASLLTLQQNHSNWSQHASQTQPVDNKSRPNKQDHGEGNLLTTLDRPTSSGGGVDEQRQRPNTRLSLGAATHMAGASRRFSMARNNVPLDDSSGSRTATVANSALRTRGTATAFRPGSDSSSLRITSGVSHRTSGTTSHRNAGAASHRNAGGVSHRAARLGHRAAAQVGHRGAHGVGGAGAGAGRLSAKKNGLADVSSKRTGGTTAGSISHRAGGGRASNKDGRLDGAKASGRRMSGLSSSGRAANNMIVESSGAAPVHISIEDGRNRAEKGLASSSRAGVSIRSAKSSSPPRFYSSITGRMMDFDGMLAERQEANRIVTKVREDAKNAQLDQAARIAAAKAQAILDAEAKRVANKLARERRIERECRALVMGLMEDVIEDTDAAMRSRWWNVNFSMISAKDVPCGDVGQGHSNERSDPYVVFEVINEEYDDVKYASAKTEPLPGESDPQWNEEVLLTLPAGSPAAMTRRPRVRVSIFDKDSSVKDDLLGCAEVVIDQDEGAFLDLKVTGAGDFPSFSMSFEFVINQFFPLPPATLRLTQIQAFGLVPRAKGKGGKGRPAAINQDPNEDEGKRPTVVSLPGRPGLYLRVVLLEVGDTELVRTPTLAKSEQHAAACILQRIMRGRLVRNSAELAQLKHVAEQALRLERGEAPLNPKRMDRLKKGGSNGEGNKRKKKRAAASLAVTAKYDDPTNTTSWQDLICLLDLPEGSPRPASLCVQLWDEEDEKVAAAEGNSPLPLAQQELRLEQAGSGIAEVKLRGTTNDVKVRFFFEMKTEGFDWGEDVRYEEDAIEEVKEEEEAEADTIDVDHGLPFTVVDVASDYVLLSGTVAEQDAKDEEM